MPKKSNPFKGKSLLTTKGERKYLSPKERGRFYQALSVLERPKDRTFCELIFWTGCRPCEALALTGAQIDIEEGFVVLQSAKKRGVGKGQHYRIVPLPRSFLKWLDEVHQISALHSSNRAHRRLWRFGRTTAWKRIKRVMSRAGLSGAKATGRGLRHSFGVLAALRGVPETRIQAWLGHESLETTAIYMDLAGQEDRAMARRMWECVKGG